MRITVAVGKHDPVIAENDVALPKQQASCLRSPTNHAPWQMQPLRHENNHFLYFSQGKPIISHRSWTKQVEGLIFDGSVKPYGPGMGLLHACDGHG